MFGMITRKGKNFRSSLGLILIVRAGSSPTVATNVEIIRVRTNNKEVLHSRERIEDNQFEDV